MSAGDSRAAATPLMRQYLTTKDRYPDAILFFRLGDFYEMFFEDAVVVSEVLELTLTSRNKGEPDEIPMCGVPHHAAAGYLSRLVERGFRVAICEQLEDPSKVKGIVKRGVVRVVTPGVQVDLDSLQAREPNYLVAVVTPAGGALGRGPAGIAVLDLSTTEFRATEVEGGASLWAELCRLGPRELLVSDDDAPHVAAARGVLPRCAVTTRPRSTLEQGARSAALTALSGADAPDLGPLARAAAGAALEYARETQPGAELPVRRLVPYRIGDHLILDETTQGHLELSRTMSGERKGSLIERIDATETATGARLLRAELLYPLRDVEAIGRRQERAAVLVERPEVRRRVREVLRQIADIERLASRAALGIATPRDLGALRDTLGVIPALAEALAELPPGKAPTLDLHAELRDRLARALCDAPPHSSRDGGIFRPGFDAGIDELAELTRSGKDRLLELEAREKERTGIGSLKLRFNKVFGYYLEVTRANVKNVPPDFIRKQTIAGGERYTTAELETLQSKILTADESLKELESERFRELCAAVAAEGDRLRALAAQVAEVDVRACHADNAHRFGWVRPQVDEGETTEIVDGRHPVVEASLEGVTFVPNDTRLSLEGERLLVITGPNMAGKSTYIRQVALIVLLAQTGSFVPAKSARVGVCDRIFTRVGASDNLARGQSTFMVEMTETAAILAHATRRSLVVLDEIGRGTSTYDGLSIAWSVAEYLHDVVGCRALFATHYHELVALSASRPGVANYNVAAREKDGTVVFLRTLVPGGASRSYGIQVARLAGVPEPVLARARAILGDLEQGLSPGGGGAKVLPARKDPSQLALFAAAPPRSPALDMLREANVDRLTPLEALNLLAQIKKAADE